MQWLGQEPNETGRFEQMLRAHRYEVDVAANWKTVIDNNHECYHCDANHKSLLELVAYKATAKWKDSGITFCHTVSRGEQNNGAYAVDNSTIEQDALFGYIWPTTIPLMFPGSCSLALFHVIPLGPEKTRERWDFYFLSKDLRPQERALIDYCSKTLAPEDIALCEAVQRGLHSRGYTQGRFVADPEHVEYSEHHVQRSILPNGETAADFKKLMNHFRLEKDGRLLFGGRGGLWSSHDPRAYAPLLHALATIFPQLKDVPIEYFWSGKVAITADGSPHFHRPADNVWVATGCNGRGVGMCTAAGKLLAKLIGGMSDRESPMPINQLKELPFHRLRLLGAQAAVWYKSWQDRRDYRRTG